MPKHSLTIDDLWTIPRVGQPVPAADGAFAIVPVTTWSMTTNEKVTRLWRVPAREGEPRALTSQEVSSEQPALSPDGKWLAFVRKPATRKNDPAKKTEGPVAKYPDVTQLYVLPLGDGGEAERLTDLPLGVQDPRWFPDGKRLAFLTVLLSEAPTVEGTVEAMKARDEEPVKAIVTEDRLYRYWDRWLADGKIHHIFMFDTGSREMTDLTPDSTRLFPLDEPADSYRIAPDGREIVFTALRSLPPHDPLSYGVFAVNVPEPGGAASAVRAVAPDHEGHAFGGSYSSDGRWLVYGMQREIDFYADRVRLVAIDRASGRHEVLTEGWDRSAMGWTFGPDSRAVYFWTEEGGRTEILSLDVPKAVADPAHRTPRPIARGGTFTDPRPAGGVIFTTQQTLCSPPEVYTLQPDGGALRRLTTFTEAAMAEIQLGKVEEVTFKGAGGRDVHMYLVYPPEESAPSGKGTARKLPLVQVIHGGPHAASPDTWHWRWNAQAFAAPGYIVAMVNFHGSTGWGQDFAASILGSWGDQPYEDIMAATDLLIERGLVDPTRMAAAGGSYGGYLSAWIASQTDRFACIVNHAGVSDFQTQYASDVTQGRRRAMGGSPWEGIEKMDRFNPMRHAAGFRSPMLILHGERDYRVPYNQALEIYNVYKAKHVPARLVIYPDENHWILKPRNSRHWVREVLGWLDRWIGEGKKSAT